MQFVTKVGEVVVLENGVAYQIFEQKEYNSRGYVAIREVPKSEEDLLNFDKYKFKFAEEVVNDENFYLALVTDKALVKELSKLK